MLFFWWNWHFATLPTWQCGPKLTKSGSTQKLISRWESICHNFFWLNSIQWIRLDFVLSSVPVFGASCSFSSSIQPFLLSCTGCLPMQVKQWKKCIYIILTWQLFAVKAQEARTEKNSGAEEELLQTLETSRTRQDHIYGYPVQVHGILITKKRQTIFCHLFITNRLFRRKAGYGIRELRGRQHQWLEGWHCLDIRYHLWHIFVFNIQNDVKQYSF